MSQEEPHHAFFIVNSTTSTLTRYYVVLIFLQENAHVVGFCITWSLCSPLSIINDRKHLISTILRTVYLLSFSSEPSFISIL